MEFRKITGLWSWKQQLNHPMNKKEQENKPSCSQKQLKQVDA